MSRRTPTTTTPDQAEGWIRRLWRYMLRHRRSVFISLGAALAGSLCQVTVPLIARQIVDGVIVQKNSPLAPWLILLIALAAASFGFTYLRRYRGGRVALEALMADMARRMSSISRAPASAVWRASLAKTLAICAFSELRVVMLDIW